MKKCSKFTRALALLLVAVMSLSACSQGGTSSQSGTASQSGTTSQGSNADPVAHDNDIVVAVAADISGFDPTALSSLYNQTVLWQMYDRLYELDEEKKPVPHLAKEAEMVSDTEWVISLVEEAKFSDGSDVTANDVKVCLDRAIACGLGGAIFAPLQSVEVVDEHTIKINTSSLYPQLPIALTNLITCILPASYIEQAEASGDWTQPITSGRYKLKERVVGESVTLIPNEYFWDESTAAKNDSLTFRVVPEASTRTIMVQTGEADLNTEFSTADYEIAAADPNVKIYEHESSVMTFMPLDCQTEYFGNEKVREAMQYAIDRESVLLVQANGYGTVNYSYISPTCYGWLDNPGGYSYDPEKAKELLAEAGYADGFTFDLYCTSAFTPAATLIQSNLAEVGITANIQMMESVDEIVSRAVDGNMPACITTWGCNPDPALVLERNIGESALGAYNVSRYVNEELEELWQYGSISENVEDRIPYYEQWQEILCEANPWVPLYVGELFALANADLQGVQLNTEQCYNFYDLHY